MTFDDMFIYKKINTIKEYLKEIQDFFKTSDSEILREAGKIHIGERLFQLIVDAILDINQHFIKELDLKLTEDFQGTFDTLAENKILPQEFAIKISGVVNLRNRVVHDYEKFDQKLFLKEFREEFADFEEYMNYIEKYLEKK